MPKHIAVSQAICRPWQIRDTIRWLQFKWPFQAKFTPIWVSSYFIFNITKMIYFIASNPKEIDCVKIEVCDFPKKTSSITESYIDSVDVTLPVILAEISPGRFNIIDGNHRMEKARKMGLKRISAYKFYVHQHLCFLTEEKAYRSYIDYWNGKCA